LKDRIPAYNKRTYALYPLASRPGRDKSGGPVHTINRYAA